MILNALISETTTTFLPLISYSAAMSDAKTMAALPGKVFFPGSSNYTSSVGSYFAAFENELTPTCVVRPTSAQDVSEIISGINTLALSGQVQLAVRGGGHTPWAGAANIQSGITLDLQNLTGVTVDPSTKVASVGSGERWSSVYSQLGAQGIAVAGGRVSKVGVAGLMTGGVVQRPPHKNSASLLLISHPRWTLLLLCRSRFRM